MTSRSVFMSAAGAMLLLAAAPSGTALGQALECEGPAPVGCFEATVSAEGASEELSGFAKSFGSSADAMWYVQLIVPGGASGMMMTLQGEPLPPPGEFVIDNFEANDGKPPAGKFVATGNADLQGSAVKGFQSVAGTVVITASSSSWVEGTFEYEGRDPRSGGTVTVEGRFKASHQGM